MKDEKGIPCTICQLWHPEEKGFSCDPNKCEKLTVWLLNHKIEEANGDQVIPYVV
jgi:hypothetical protein